MLKNHPKGLLVAFFANMGERFGFYTMMAILVLFLQARFGLSTEKAGTIYSWFYFSIYALALLGGILADATKKYKMVIFFGILIMFAGYAALAVPGLSLAVTEAALLTIALGNGLFKGNLQAVVGQMYDDPKYAKLRDSAFMIFYMGINIGAFFAPFAAIGIRNWWLGVNGFAHDGSLPSLCHMFLDGKLADVSVLQTLANEVSLNGNVADLQAFAGNYLNVFAKGYNYAFGIAAGAMVVSLLAYVLFNKLLPDREVKKADVRDRMEFNPVALAVAAGAVLVTAFALHFIPAVGWTSGSAFGLFAGFVTWIILSAKKEEKSRVVALILVFAVVIFFWMSFHQNGLTQTFYARDYTVKQAGAFTNIFFTLPSMLALAGAIAGLFMMLKPNIRTRISGGAVFIFCMLLNSYFLTGFPAGLFSRLFQPFEAVNPISPEVFQSFNPLFIVGLSFPVMGVFAWMSRKGVEPSTPGKIGIGMIIAAVGFVVVLLSSTGLPSPSELNGTPVDDAYRVSPYWLISSYLILTVAELFLSPMGLSFVSRVAPSRFQGLMQGGWLLAAAVGNKLLFVGSILWDKVALSSLWLVFIVCCLISAAFIFSILKRLEKACS